MNAETHGRLSVRCLYVVIDPGTVRIVSFG
jgi:hypothetical protein